MGPRESHHGSDYDETLNFFSKENEQLVSSCTGKLKSFGSSFYSIFRREVLSLSFQLVKTYTGLPSSREKRPPFSIRERKKPTSGSTLHVLLELITWGSAFEQDWLHDAVLPTSCEWNLDEPACQLGTGSGFHFKIHRKYTNINRHLKEKQFLFKMCEIQNF